MSMQTILKDRFRSYGDTVLWVVLITAFHEKCMDYLMSTESRVETTHVFNPYNLRFAYLSDQVELRVTISTVFLIRAFKDEQT